MFLIALIVFLLLPQGHSYISITNLSELPLDENGRLSSHWLLFPSGSCEKYIEDTWEDSGFELRSLASISGELENLFFPDNSTAECEAVCLERGTPYDYLQHYLPLQLFQGSQVELRGWIHSNCQKTEFGFISFLKNEAIVYWISPENKRIKISNLLRGERNTFWTTTVLGHKFEVVDSVTKQVVGSFTAEFNGINHIGDPGSGKHSMPNVEQGVRETFEFEMQRHRQVRRSFTELGFAKGRLPPDLWSSIQAYYYNNRNNAAREEYKGYIVNWWEVDPYLIPMPWGLKGYWQTRLRALVEKWIGGNITLENTDIYGMRRYEDGARLLSHVDRQPTHAVSLIVNVAQSNIREPWKIEIYDHADRLHEIEMNPGDIVYYESAKALHGRMKPLEGDFYVNFFTHYRPVGDPEWFLKPNPEGTPFPLINLDGECRITKDGAKECDAPTPLPTLSPTGHVVRSAQDLFDYWKLVSPKNSAHSEL